MPCTKNRPADGTRQPCWEEAPQSPLCCSAHGSALQKGHSGVPQCPRRWPEVPAALRGSGPREAEGPRCPERRTKEPLARGEGWWPRGTFRPPASRVPHTAPCFRALHSHPEPNFKK